MDDELEFDLNSTDSKGAISIPIYGVHNSDILSQLVDMQTLQEKQKLYIFEATEATISRNKRSQVKKSEVEVSRLETLCFLKIHVSVH